MPDQPTRPDGSYAYSQASLTANEARPMASFYFMGGPASLKDAALINQIFAGYGVISSYGQPVDLKRLETREELLRVFGYHPKTKILGKTEELDEYDIYELRNIEIDPGISRQQPPPISRGPLTLVPPPDRRYLMERGQLGELEDILHCVDATMKVPTVKRCIARNEGDERTLEFKYNISIPCREKQLESAMARNARLIRAALIQPITDRINQSAAGDPGQIQKLMEQHGLKGTITGPQVLKPEDFDGKGTATVSYVVKNIQKNNKSVGSKALTAIADQINFSLPREIGL